MATNMVVEEKGVPVQKLEAKVLEAAVALLRRFSVCFVVGSAWAHVRFKALLFFDLCVAPPSE